MTLLPSLMKTQKPGFLALCSVTIPVFQTFLEMKEFLTVHYYIEAPVRAPELALRELALLLDQGAL